MRGDFIIAVDDLTDFAEGYSADQISKCAKLAINKAADFARAEGARRMGRQVLFPPGYLTPSQERFYVAKYAQSGEDDAVVFARHRATSLARFATPLGSRQGVIINIKPGGAKAMKRAFLMRLKSGQADTKGNMGLAVRTEPGVKPFAAHKPKEIAEGLWLLYGPSVSQVFKTVRTDLEPEVMRKMREEFVRLLGVGL